jgi:hypothetical protein
MWTAIWIASGMAIVLLMGLTAWLFGRGHMGVKQSQRHYLDEVESRSHFPWF